MPAIEKLGAILLTGSTGFLGAYLLKELINKTNGIIYCLIRAEYEAVGMKRIVANLDTYFLWQELFKKRIMPVYGDLSQSLLGLDRHSYDDLCNAVDVLYHNTSAVNFQYPYSELTGIRRIEKFVFFIFFQINF